LDSFGYFGALPALLGTLDFWKEVGPNDSNGALQHFEMKLVLTVFALK
jgi:hypothetical protein